MTDKISSIISNFCDQLFNTKSEDISGVGAYGSIQRFVCPGADKSLNFSQGDFYISQMMTHPSIIDTRSDIIKNLASFCLPQTSGNITFSLGENSLLGNAWHLYKTIAGTLSFGTLFSNPHHSTIGSFNGTWNINEIDYSNRSANVNFTVVNEMGLASGTRYGYDNTDQTLLDNNPFSSDGFLGTVEQSWTWDEKINF